MIFIDKMRDFKIYKKPFYLPTVEKEKKKRSAVLLLTPNYTSSVNLINSPLTVNRLRFQSYYFLKDAIYCIYGKKAKSYEEDDYVRESTVEEMYQNLNEMTAAERNKLPDSAFGLPKKRKYPLDTEAHVRSAIRFFNYVDKEDEVELAGNINKAIRKFNMTDIKVGAKNRFSKYYKPINESADYIDENDTQTPIDNLASFIGFTGYAKDIQEVASEITPNFFYQVTRDLELNIKSINDIPILMVNVGVNGVDEADYNAGSHEVIPVFVYDNRDIQRSVYTQIIEHYYPQHKGTTIPSIAADRALGLPYHGYYTTFIFEEKHISIKEFLDKSDVEIAKIFDEKFRMEAEDLHIESINENANYSPLSEVNMEDAFDTYVFDDIKYEHGLMLDDTVFFFNEASSTAADTNLKKLLYLERIRKRTEIIEKLKRVKEDIPTIKFAYPDLHKYQTKNLYYDLYYYNEAFFKNNTLAVRKAYDAYLTLMDRMLNNPEIKANGYEKTTIFIPIHDWHKNRSTRMWLYREDLNPISIIYELMRLESPRLKEVFKNNEVIFFGNNEYFKINFSAIEDIKKMAVKFKLFINKIINNEEFDLADIDTTMDNTQDARSIQTDIIDKIDIAKGVDLTSKVQQANSIEKTMEDAKKNAEKEVKKTSNIVTRDKVANVMKKQFKTTYNVSTVNDPTKEVMAKVTTIPKQISQDEKENDIVVPKNIDVKKVNDQEEKLNKMAEKITTVSNNVTIKSTDAALDALDTDEEFKEILADINSTQNNNGVDIDSTRAARMNKLNNEFLEKEVQGQTVKDMLEENQNKEITTTKLNISTPNKEWSEMTYMNFDKEYDLNADIVACFYHLTKTSRPISIRNLSATDISTSEDRLVQYVADMEDYRGKRFKVKLDIPIMKDNRLRLRGNDKSIQMQLFNMPIIKTDRDTAQVVTNYRKIFVSRFNDSVVGRSNSVTAAIVKALEKCTDKTIKITKGENQKVSDKYELPLDYIDLSKSYTKIECSKYIFYFDQDMLRNEYAEDLINISTEVPIGIRKEDHSIIAYTMLKNGATLSQVVAQLLMESSQNFTDEFNALKWATGGTYSRCKILGYDIPLVLICGYLEGLTTTLNKAGIEFTLNEKLPPEVRNNLDYICIKFKDGYLYCKSTYEANMLLNGLKDTSIDIYSFTEIDNRNIYYEMLDDFGGRARAGGLENFKDCLVDPITEDVLKHYKLPTDFISILLYTNAMLCDNKYIKHTDTSSRRIRRYEQIAAYTYEVLSEGYDRYANALRQGKDLPYSVKQTAVIDKVLATQNTSDDAVLNALGAVETTNTVTYKGKAGLNSERSYSIDKRVYDPTMINILATSTNFAATVGVNRQATMDMNVVSARGYLEQTVNANDMTSSKSMCATEALTPFGTTHDDPMRTCMTFIQTSKHSMRTIESDPLLITCGADDALAYLTQDKFAFKAKEDGEIIEVNDDYILIKYKDGKTDYINLKVSVEKNSAGGFYVPMKLDKSAGISVGKKVKAGSIIAYDNTSFSNSVGESDDISYNIGKLAKVAVISTDDGFEDSGFCTDRLSKSLSCKVITMVSHVIDKDCIVYGIKKVGDHVEPEDHLLIWQTAFDDEESKNVAAMLADTSGESNLLGKKTIDSNISGTIVDIKMYRTCELKDMSPSLQKVVRAYEAPINDLKKKLDAAGVDTKEMPSTYKLDPTGKLKKAEEAVLIEFYLEYVDRVAVGDKIVYFAANKATIKDVIPDDLAPYTDFRPKEPVDAFVSQISIDKRIVTSSLITGATNKLLIELDRSVKDVLGIKYDESKL